MDRGFEFRRKLISFSISCRMNSFSSSPNNVNRGILHVVLCCLVVQNKLVKKCHHRLIDFWPKTPMIKHRCTCKRRKTKCPFLAIWSDLYRYVRFIIKKKPIFWIIEMFYKGSTWKLSNHCPGILITYLMTSLILQWYNIPGWPEINLWLVHDYAN